MKIVISGANGFVGRNLNIALQKKGWEVIPLSRADLDLGTGHMSQKISGADVVINLAGAPIVHRWSEAYKEELRNSRIITTERIVDAMAVAVQVPKLFISASAIGIYAAEGRHTEHVYKKAGDFIGKLCADWEAEAEVAESFTRTVIFRFGIVLAKDGGALPMMALPFKLGVGGKIGSGKQGFSWIHLADLIAAYIYMIENNAMSGTYNLTSPEPCNNLLFTQTIAHELHRPAFFTVPVFALKLIYGEGAIAVSGGQIALPERLLSEGFQYRFPALEGALKDILLV